MRICLVYDCLYPYTVGGGERWYRSLAERLAQAGHDVTYLTLRQWDRGEAPAVAAGVTVVAVGPRMGLYTGGRRRIGPPLVFGAGVLWHLLRHGRRYEVVHCAAFPYFSLLASGLVRRLAGYGLVVDWFEVWSAAYWRDYLGRIGGAIGGLVQRLCARLPQRAFCLSQLHAQRLRALGLRGPITVLRGLYDGGVDPHPEPAATPTVVFAGRLIPEKRAPLGAEGVIAAAARIENLRGEFLGDGPDREALDSTIAEHGGQGIVSAPGFLPAEQVDDALAHALCLLLPSRREGYGLVVVEAAARSTPSIVVADEDNAATELIEDGVNGVLVTKASPEAIARAIERVHGAGRTLRQSTERWFAEHAHELALEASLRTVLDVYAERPGSQSSELAA